MIPKINITLQNGQLGSVGESADGVAGLIILSPSDTITNKTVFTLRSIDDAKATNLKDVPFALQQITEFYNEAGEGSKLYVLFAVYDEATMAKQSDLFSAAKGDYAKYLLDYAAGEITILGVCFNSDPNYQFSPVGGIDPDVTATVTACQTLAADYLAKFTPFVGVIGCVMDGTITPASAANLTQSTKNFVSVAVCSSDALKEIEDADTGKPARSASVGLVLGRAAAVPVQRKIARVKDGSLSINAAYIGDKKIEDADWQTIAEKGYITIGKYPNKSGYYFIDDTLATAPTDDYSTVSKRRTMNKLVRIVYATYVNELNDDIELTSEGKLTPATAKYYEGLIKNAVNSLMTGNGELSSFEAYVDVNQNVLSTGKITIKCAAVPKGYSQEISVILGFSNPALSV